MDQFDFKEYYDDIVAMAISYAPKLILALVVLFIGYRIIKMLERLLKSWALKINMDPALQLFSVNLLRWTLKVLLFIAVADMIGVKTTSFVAIVGAAGLAVGLALQGTLANFAGGVLLMVFKPYKVGDLIESQGVLGNVKEIQIFNTILTTPENKTAVMPNGAIMNNHMINFTTEGKIRVDLKIGVSYKADISQARKAILSVMEADSRVLKSPAPLVAVAELGDSSIVLAVRPWCDPAVYWDVYFETLENSKLALDQAGVSIPFPQLDVHMIQK
ncbi:MAG: mechanosensitive ion channel [Cryomorphaceae bacterium]|nr:mechanosensitive ion channel [Cryomorphaceae bacterium]